jgi:3-hydroxybutyryl-CoA dehydrogenase
MLQNPSIKNLCVVGGGLMGTQIALRAARHGFNVSLIEPNDDAHAKAGQVHVELLDGLIASGFCNTEAKEATLTRLQCTQKLAAAATADLVIEAVHEQLELKRQLFAELDRLCPEHTILATNSSSIRISLIEDATQRLDRVLNLHYYGPVDQRPMVDLMRGSATSNATFSACFAFVQANDLVPLVVRKESTGFVFNRVWRAVKREVLHLVDEGVASPQDVDRAWMVFTGQDLGPFGLMDQIGLDVIRDIEKVYQRESGEERDVPPAYLEEMIQQGNLGEKSGKGFYTHPNPAYKDPEWLKGERLE